MQVNSLFQGMFGIGVPGAAQSGVQMGTAEEASQQFEDMLVEHSKQNQTEKKPAAKKEDPATGEKPQQAEDGKQEPAGEEEEGMEVAAALVTSQPVVFFDVVNAQEPTAAMEAVVPMEDAAAIEAPAVQETAIAPVQEQQVEQAPQQVGQAPVQQPEGFQEEGQQVPDVQQAAPDAQEAPAEAAPGKESAPEATTARMEAPPEEKPDDTQVQDVEVEARPVFQRETAAPVKVGESYEPLAPEEPQAPQKLADDVMQMLSVGENRVEIALNPANLGKMTIEVTRMQDGALHVVLGAVGQKATALLKENSEQLHTLLAAANQNDVRIEVRQQEPPQEQGQFMNPDEGGKQQPQQQHKPQQQAESEDFVQQLRLGLTEKEEE